MLLLLIINNVISTVMYSCKSQASHPYRVQLEPKSQVSSRALTSVIAPQVAVCCCWHSVWRKSDLIFLSTKFILVMTWSYDSIVIPQAPTCFLSALSLSTHGTKSVCLSLPQNQANMPMFPGLMPVLSLLQHLQYSSRTFLHLNIWCLNASQWWDGSEVAR